MDARHLSQAELARRIGISQQNVARLASGKAYGTKHLHRIARELGTTPAYLAGEIDDPEEGAPPPPRPVQQQYISLPVALPTTPALAAAFRGVLMASRDMDEAELAHELAKRLPNVLRIAGDALLSAASDVGDDYLEPASTLGVDQTQRKRA